MKVPKDMRAGLEKLLQHRIDPEMFAGMPSIDDAASAAAFMKDLVRSGALPKGSEVPADALARVIGVHRNTMSKALTSLVEEGYLQRRPGRPARVVADRAVLPQRRSEMISHTQVAREYGFEITSEVTRLERCSQKRIHEERRARVVGSLDLGPGDQVIILSRIRKLRSVDSAQGPSWIPALAETAYFAVDRLPSLLYDDLQAGRMKSIRDYLRHNRIEVVTSEYRIRTSSLAEPFLKPWAEFTGLTVRQVQALGFLRFESTTHSHRGPVEYSIAYLSDRVFAIRSANVSVEIRTEELAQATTTTEMVRTRSDRTT